MNYNALLQSTINLSLQAAVVIKKIYNSQLGLSVTHKKDHSPLTEADLQSHQVIVSGLQSLTPDVPILSEESSMDSIKVLPEWSHYWLVDPLDGTKEFIQRTGEFTVNIALVFHQRPVLGVVCAPLDEMVYYAIRSNKAYKKEKNRQPVIIKTNTIHEKLAQNLPLQVVTSRRHGKEALAGCLQQIGQAFDKIETVTVGSALKMCLVAEGKADIYPRFGPTCFWDTAAAQVIVETAGGGLVSDHFNPLLYPSGDVINPYFYALGDINYPWQEILAVNKE